MDTKQKLALLQAYPLGTLEVEIAPEGKRATLVGLSSDGGALVRTHDGARLALSCEDLKPFLKSFSALTKQLPDGTIAAVEVAKMVLGLSLKHCEADYLAGIQAHMDIHGDCGVYLPDAGGASVNIYNDWLISTKSGDAMVPLAVYDYLRRNHFALPLNGRPLVLGVDYIEEQD